MKLSNIIAATGVIAATIFTPNHALSDKVKTSVRTICLPDTSMGQKMPDTGIVFQQDDCTMIDDSIVTRYIENSMKNNPKYASAYVMQIGKEIKKNHTFSADTSPYTGTKAIKIDYNLKGGQESITKWYTYTPHERIQEVSIRSIQAML